MTLMSGPTKKPLGVAELEAHLAEQLRFLELSAAAFDSGFDGEAKRLATTIRVMLHDTKVSKSLLSQIGKKNREFFDTAWDIVPGNKAPYQGLIVTAHAATGPRYLAPLDNTPFAGRKTDFETWWGKLAFIDNKGRQFSRKDLVLTAANQDGGTHVDPALDEGYAELSKGSSMNVYSVSSEGRKFIEHAERAAIRQISHEVLKSIVPGYSKMPNLEGVDALTGSVSIVRAAQPSVVRSPQAEKSKVRRNAPCPCGSGKKFKRCHGAIV